MSDGRAAGLYTLALVPAAGAALVVSGWIMDLSHQTPGPPSGVDAWALNILPALVIGLLVYLPLARFVGSRQASGRPRGSHAGRSAPFYVVALGLGILLLHDGPSPDFWSFGQLVLWVWLVAVAGIVADGLTALRARRRAIMTA